MDKRYLIARRAAHYFKDGDVVKFGIGIPSICGDYAESGVLFPSENGFIGVGAIYQNLKVNERAYRQRCVKRAQRITDAEDECTYILAAKVNRCHCAKKRVKYIR